MGADTRVWNGAVYRLDSRAESLARKREITEARLAYARSVGDARLIAMNVEQLARISAWERGES